MLSRHNGVQIHSHENTHAVISVKLAKALVHIARLYFQKKTVNAW